MQRASITYGAAVPDLISFARTEHDFSQDALDFALVGLKTYFNGSILAVEKFPRMKYPVFIANSHS